MTAGSKASGRFETSAWRALATAALAVVAVFAVLVPAGPVHAAEAQDQGSVAIEITAPPIDGAVAFGEEVGRKFVVESLEDPCWVRMRPELALSSTSYAIEEAHRAPDEPGWVAAPDGWYYWTSPLSAGQAALFTTSFALSHDTQGLEGAASGESMRLRETGYAEAIQAKDTYPDFESPNPWEGAYKGPGEPAGDRTDTTKGSGSLQKTGDSSLFVVGGFAAVALLALVATFAILLCARREARRCRRQGEGPTGHDTP